MIASRHPAERKCRTHWFIRAMLTQRKTSHSRSRSGHACPANAAHTTRLPAARAPRATRTGNAPSPAINPSGSTRWIVAARLRSAQKQALPEAGRACLILLITNDEELLRVLVLGFARLGLDIRNLDLVAGGFAGDGHQGLGIGLDQIGHRQFLAL